LAFSAAGDSAATSTEPAFVVVVLGVGESRRWNWPAPQPPRPRPDTGELTTFPSRALAPMPVTVISSHAT
jgi:hypothetical protein